MSSGKLVVCKTKVLTPSQSAIAARRSVEVNPDNALAIRAVTRTPIGRRGGPRRLAVVVGRKWPATGVRLTVQFLDAPPKALRTRILLHMNAWSKTASVEFTETAGGGQVRIARLDSPEDMAGYWSYVGTEILGIDDGEPTLNLEGFTTRTPEAEFRRVVRHEAGHTLGFEHEHMRRALVAKIDRKKAIAYFDETEGWTAEETDEQVLTPVSEKTLMGTLESDPTSIMCYHIPARITKDGKAIRGGDDINARDFAFAAVVYPRHAAAPAVAADNPASTLAAAPAASAPAPRPVPGDDDAFHLVVMDAFDAADGAAPRGAASDRGRPVTRPESRRPRFARLFASYRGARVTAAMRLRSSPKEAPTRFGEIIRIQERLKAYTNREKGSLPTDAEMVEFGASLFETLFQGDIRRLYDEARSTHGSSRLRFVLTSMIPWIAEKPWEFAYDASRKSFLATEEVQFIRNVLTAVPADVPPAEAGPLRILVASAQPVAFGRLSIAQETEVIRRGFAPLVEAGLAQVRVLPRASPPDLHAALLTDAYRIVHFIGHGGFDEDRQEGFLVFQDDRGGSIELRERYAREIFCRRGVNLVFLNACQTGRGGHADFNKGVAQALVSHGLPALVANQYSVLDSSATSFAQHFYGSLAQGASLGQAARESRIAVNYSMSGESIDWAVPVVYARNPDMTFSTGPITPVLRDPARSRRPPRRDEGRPLRVAVCDIDQVFPMLEDTLEQLNAAQPTIGFSLERMSTPLDIWDLEERAADGSPYLWAERLAHRLENKAAELRVDIVACITRHPLRDDDWLNLYGWWPGGKKPPVIILSFAGFDALPAAGSEADRAIANLLVTCLAGFLADTESHRSGARDCPLSFNESRRLRYVVGPQRFDPRCRAHLRKRVPAELPALEAILRAFPGDEGSTLPPGQA